MGSALLFGLALIVALPLLFHLLLLYGLAAPRVAHEQVPSELGIPDSAIGEVQLQSVTGKRLFAWLISPDSGSAGTPGPATLIMHGWGSNAAMMLALAKPLREAGHRVLILDARCHGRSEGERFMSLPRFAEDVASGHAFLRTQAEVDPERISLIGHSVGAAAVLLHASRREDIHALVSLSAFAHPREIMWCWIDAHRIPRRIIGEQILAHVQRVIGYRFDDIAPINTLPRVRCPVLLVHGRDDRAVPLSAAERLAATREDVELLIVEGDHDLRETLKPYARQLLEFLK